MKVIAKIEPVARDFAPETLEFVNSDIDATVANGIGHLEYEIIRQQFKKGSSIIRLVAAKRGAQCSYYCIIVHNSSPKAVMSARIEGLFRNSSSKTTKFTEKN